MRKKLSVVWEDLLLKLRSSGESCLVEMEEQVYTQFLSSDLKAFILSCYFLEMKIFSSLVKDSTGEYIDKYFNAGGSANEILEALAETKQRDPGSAMAAIKILRSLFLKFVTTHANYLSILLLYVFSVF
jgi:hypothetical protein